MMDYDDLHKLAVEMNVPRKIRHGLKRGGGSFSISEGLNYWADDMTNNLALYGWQRTITRSVDGDTAEIAIEKGDVKWRATELLCVCRRVKLAAGGGKNKLVASPIPWEPDRTVASARNLERLEDYCLKNMHQLLFESGLQARYGTNLKV